MNTTIILIIIGITYFTLEKKIRKLEDKTSGDNIAPFSQKLYFDLHRCIIHSSQVLSSAKVTKEEIDKDYDKWTKAFRTKWQGFFKDNNSQLNRKDTNFSLTYLTSDNMFIIEGASSTSILPNRTTPNNTRLWDRTLRYYPNKDKDLREEELRLEVDLREDDNNGKTTCLVTVGIRKFENKPLGKSTYTKLLDFPFSHPYTKEIISNDELNKYGFQTKDPSPWYDKDDFGKITAHQWDTEIKYEHKTKAEVTWIT